MNRSFSSGPTQFDQVCILLRLIFLGEEIGNLTNKSLSNWISEDFFSAVTDGGSDVIKSVEFIVR